MMCSFQDRDNLYLVMDLLTGGDLRYHICHKKKFSEEQTKFFLACVILGLEYIHSKNVIHRDIKPENLVCDDRGYIAITDFGVAKKNLKDNSSETSGTPGYMAPEVLCAQNHSFPVDFFALGVMGYEFMLGVRPYLGRSRKEIKEVVLNKQARIHKRDIPPGWSLEAVDCINLMLQRKPSHRLGYNGIAEIKTHPWFDGFNWEELYNKKMSSPFTPKMGDNFDKRYCEGVEKIGSETQERYRYYMSKEKYSIIFNNYTFMFPEAEAIAQKYTANTTASTSSSAKLVSAQQLSKYLSNNNINNPPTNNPSSAIQHNHAIDNISNQSRTLSPHGSSRANPPVSAKGFQSSKDNKGYQTLRDNSSKINIPQRPLSRLNNQSSGLNLGVTYRNSSNHHYSNSNVNLNLNNNNGNKTNFFFDLNKIEMKSTRLNGEKRLPVLSKNASMKFLNINSSYLSNLNLGNYNSNINKKITTLNKQMYNGNYNKNSTKYGTISASSSNNNIYRKSSSMSSLKHVHY